jgi:hypothetical protein
MNATVKEWIQKAEKDYATPLIIPQKKEDNISS